ncbi:hypothetical protein V5799_007168 [Amblyomma americanum]|uniref:Uncharacterized protein n=1 Tax=Amblyomma americanum TaxID=6943 RepID=A0AAQ4DUB2_AMBAM
MKASNDHGEKETLVLLPQDAHHRTLKIAVAMALIRAKPSGVSAGDYARKLAEDMHSSDGKILERCKSLENDILHLRQKVALISIRGGIRPEPPAFRRILPETCPEGLSDSAERISQHWTFLENYLSITSNIALLGQSDNDAESEELLLCSVDNLLRTIREGAPLGHVEMDLCKKALLALAKLCDNRRCNARQSLHAAAMNFITESVHDIVVWKEPFNYTQLENLTSCVAALASGQALVLHTTTLLTDKLLQFASHINTLQEDQRGLEADYFDRTFYLLQCTETVVESLKQISHLDCCKLSDTAKTLMEFSIKCQETQPLFANYLYEVVTKLNSSLDACNKSKQQVKRYV